MIVFSCIYLLFSNYLRLESFGHIWFSKYINRQRLFSDADETEGHRNSNRRAKLLERLDERSEKRWNIRRYASYNILSASESPDIMSLNWCTLLTYYYNYLLTYILFDGTILYMSSMYEILYYVRELECNCIFTLVIEVMILTASHRRVIGLLCFYMVHICDPLIKKGTICGVLS